jgi:Bacterial extracellular solute-binding protein/von Willebrand factor type A domain
MGRHQAVGSSVEGQRGRRRWAWLLAAIGVAVLAGASLAAALSSGDGPTTARHIESGRSTGTAAAAACPHKVTVVAATSFASVLRRVAGSMTTGPNCVAVRVIPADGRLAAPTAAALGADAWIPDDTSWATVLNKVALPDTTGHIVATSPLYFVTRRDSPSLPANARSWLGLGRTLADVGSPWHLVLADPAASGDGLAGAGGLAGAIIGPDGPLIAGLDLFRVWDAATTKAAPALPTGAAQVGIVPEYALLASGHARDYTVIAPTDGTTLLNYTWLPTSAGLADPDKAAALNRLYHALTSATATQALAAARLRGPAWPSPPPQGADTTGLPTLSAAAMAAIPAHLAYHVLSTWHPDLRRSNMLVVLDVSGSMNDPAPGTRTPKITLVRQGISQVNALLPDTAELGLWQFGSQLAPPNDWQTLVPPAPLTDTQRAAITASAGHLQARPTGTGLYDTILAAYRYQQAHYRSDMPNEVVLFTDGVNQDDPVSISLAQLRTSLAATDPNKRVQLSIFGIGRAVPANLLQPAVTPVGGQVDTLTTSDQVIGAFVHAVSGALSGVPG